MPSRAAPVALARRAVRRWLAGEHPPDGAAVERVLAVARGERRACEVAPGLRVERRQQRLRSCPVRSTGRHLGNLARPWAPTPRPIECPRARPGKVLISAEELHRPASPSSGGRSRRTTRAATPLLVAVLKGAFIFLGDLVRAIPIPHEIDFMAVSSYGAATRSSGIVRIVKDLDIDLEGRHVLIVEDIVDSGLTLAYLRRMLAARNPASLEVCALLARETITPVDRASLRYVGFTIPKDWVVGYGLDVAERWRNLPDLHLWDDEG